jgi:hypothetical protein
MLQKLSPRVTPDWLIEREVEISESRSDGQFLLATSYSRNTSLYKTS